jgi:hypothetical protein
MSEPDFSKGDVMVKKHGENRPDNTVPESEIEILGVLERIDTDRNDEDLYMLARGRPVKTEKIDRNYKLKNSSSDG